MTTENRRFLASDLSQELELPRSTINDWLTRYAEYLESENRGKRRFYSEKSLNILREIAELRNAGKSSFEIEQQLAARYGIRPEVAHPEEPETAVAEAPTAPRDPEENSASAPGEGETLPMLRPAFDEMSSQFTREFTALAAKFEELERERRRMWFAGLAIMAAALLLLLLLGAALWTLHGKFERSKAESTAAMATLTRDGEKLSGQLESIRAEQRRETEKLGVMLDRSRADFQRNAERLGSELAEQRKGFEHRIAELSADAEKKLQTETLRLKEEFARKQQQELREQAAAYEKKLREAEAGVAAAKGDADRARKESDELRHRLEQLEKSRSAEVESPGAAK